MSQIAAVLFLLAALGGIVMLVRLLRRRELPWPLAIAHGVLAAIALILVLIAFLQGKANLATPLVLFVIAALGGFVLLSFHLRKRVHPLWLAVIHGLVAVTGFIFLLLAILS